MFTPTTLSESLSPTIAMHPEEPHSPSERRHSQIVLDSESRQSTRQDWLAGTILTLKIIATTAEVAPLPYFRSALGAVVILLETVEKMKKNRDDLLDVCASIVEMIFLVKDEVACHGEAIGTRLAGLCEEFISLLQALQTGLDRFIRKRAGIKGWLYDSLRVESVADQIGRYRYRINELRANLILAATLNTNLHVVSVRTTGMGQEDICTWESEFRRIALGDVNLLHEIDISDRAAKIKVFTARITGQPSVMTVVQYEDEKTRWKSDLEEYSRIRHPHVWQLFGFTTTPVLKALIFHDELIPLVVYRQFYRPKSDLAWVFIEGMLFQQFKSTSKYHHWPLSTTAGKTDELEATICVKPEPVRLSLAMPGIEVEIPTHGIEAALSHWHSVHYHNQVVAKATAFGLKVPFNRPNRPNIYTQDIEWTHFFAALIPIRFQRRLNFEMQENLFLGCAVADTPEDDLVSVAHIPISSELSVTGWEAEPLLRKYDPGSTAVVPNRFTFSSGSFPKLECSTLRCLVTWSLAVSEDETMDLCWLSQANMCIGDLNSVPRGCHGRFGYGLIEELLCGVALEDGFQDLLREEGTLQEAHLFLCTPRIRREGLRMGIQFPKADQFYWSLDPSAGSRLTEAECDSLGLPRLRFVFILTARLWHDYHYYAIREFFIAKGVDPYSQDVTRILGLPFAEVDASRVSILPCSSH
ncbi:hypothetical protein R3P38DRAFT_3027882 [Favolaschia claudopus]|uniref:Fungal N-terminal domain-containing protein n=1 Tax=Favolaschia claudopus TaxID=2862362 RepID=A0AAW0AF19_9AGAR